MTEAKIQSEFFQWFYNSYPDLRIPNKAKKAGPRALLVHNYNNPRSHISGSKLNGMGLCKGFPDMTLHVSRGGYNALHLELKKEGEKPKPEQLEVHRALVTQGSRVEWHDNLEDLKNSIVHYLNLK